jgi:cytochrome c553
VHHSIILRFAIALTVLLVVVSFAFAWAVSHREQKFAARASAADVAYSDTEAVAAYVKRCSACHVVEQMESWLAARPADQREAALFGFLQQHGKAPEAENHVIATYLAAKAPGKP